MTDAQIISESESRIRDELKDPLGAQVRTIRIVSYKESHVVCGEINGKNSYGAFTGFQKFAANPFTAALAVNPTGSTRINSIANAGLNEICR